ncbi:helix-turn-helix transcriptional regulator [Paucibacter sp. DJ1R-11]|uniref:helix-turn-helix transcriptional regulator n=1 Tax=Paucibacter sp. DJ1R-11 TaxID=2893556 RepID=UPI00398C6435
MTSASSGTKTSKTWAGVTTPPGVCTASCCTVPATGAVTVVYELIKAKLFPRPIKVGSASLWVDSDISTWIEVLQMARDANE